MSTRKDRNFYTDEGETSEWVVRAVALLPAWFVPRMIMDEWHFGLMLTTGQVLCISRIDDVKQAADGSIWLDVTMLPDNFGSEHVYGRVMCPMVAPTHRLEASINAAHVVAAFELADS